MKRGLAFSLFAVLALTALFSALPRPAADEAPQPGTLLLVAGTGAVGFAGDTGPALQAVLDTPYGMALDAAGNLFIADQLNDRVRKVSSEGIITTVAGGGVKAPGDAEGGPATLAKLNSPQAVALDGTGNLFIADLGHQRVRKVSADGLITTAAGTGKAGFTGEGGPATAARLEAPAHVAVDAAGNLFIAERGNHRVRKVGVDGIITTVAGTDEAGFSGDNGPATAAQLDAPHGMAVDAAGNLFVADSKTHRVRKVSPDGIITTVAGTGEEGFSGDGGPATQAKLNRPEGLAVDTAGNLFIADLLNHRIRKVTPDGIITTVAGSDKVRFSGVGGPATEAGLRGPLGVVVDAVGNLFVSDSGYFTGREEYYEDSDERVLKVVGVAAPGLIAGRPFPKN
jgi:sugar lactone lactonase YvrE